MKINFAFIAAFALMFSAASYIKAAPGDLDSTFGIGGIVTTAFPPAAAILATDVATQADGRIVIVGRLEVPSPNGPVILARYNANGSLDTTFGSGGRTTVTFGFGHELSDLAIQADGRIVVAGVASLNSNYDFLVARFDTTGALDTSFDNDGIVTIDMGRSDFGTGLAIQPDGKIVISGSAIAVGSPGIYAVARLEPDGSLDGSFDEDGRVTTTVGPDWYTQASGLALQQNGKIIVAGVKFNLDFGSAFALVRYNPNGSLDTTFDGDGIAITAVSAFYDLAYDVAVQSDGKIVAAGHTSVIAGDKDIRGAIGVVRYNPNDGSLDTSFDGDGLVITTLDFLDYTAFAFSVAIQSNGKIVVAGSGEDTNMNTASVIVRYDPNGSLDTTFGLGGVTSSGTNNLLSSLAIQSDGKLVAAGDNSVDAIVARFLNDSPAITGTITYGNAIGAPVSRNVSNVLMSGSGSILVSALTLFPGGNYVLSGFGSGAYAVTPSKTGGVNGAITSFDAANISGHAAGTNPLTTSQLIVADVSGNGTISSFDAGQIARYVAGLPGSGSAGTWRFTPANRSYASITTNVAGEDFTAFLMGEVSGNWLNTGARQNIPWFFHHRGTEGTEKIIILSVPSVPSVVKNS